MTIIRTLSATFALVTALLVSAPAIAQTRSDKAVYFTFSQPVAIPETTLPAGRYLFRLADSLTNRSIVQIYSADGSKLHAMLMTMPTERTQAAEEPEVRFLETAANQPPAIGSYWYVGDRRGWEFIYPREQARRLAQSSKANVLTTASDANAAEAASAELVRISPSGEQLAVETETPEATAPRAARGEVADVDQPVSTTARNSAPARRALPSTATFQPLLVLAGALAALAALAARLQRRRAR